jgi:2'-5' RNA ligase
VALEIPEDVRQNLEALENEWRSNEQTQVLAAKMRWVRPENLHVTLKFIGEIPGEKLDAISAALRVVHTDSRVDLKFCGLGCVAGKDSGVFWTDIEPVASLKPLASDIDRYLQPLGIRPENRDFHPHVTLARFKDRHLLSQLRKVIDAKTTHADGLRSDFGSMRAHEFQLMQSKTISTGPIYSKLESFRFTTAA